MGLAVWFWTRPADTLDDLYQRGQLSQVLSELDRTPDSLDSQRFLLGANSLRQFGRNGEFNDWLRIASDRPELSEAAQLAQALFNVQHGEQLPQSPQALSELVATLQQAGARTGDAYSVVIQGLLALNKLDEAKALLEQWKQNAPTSSQREYLAAVFLNVSGEIDQAEKALIQCVEQHPEHELSWFALAELYARPPHVRFEHSERVWREFIERFPLNQDAQVKLASVRRRLGQSDSATLKTLPADTPAAMLERAYTAFDLGDYAAAVECWQTLGVSSTEELNALIDRAFQLTMRGQGELASQWNERVSRSLTASALAGRRSEVSASFHRAANRVARLRRLQDLANEQAFDQSVGLLQESKEVTALEMRALELPESSSTVPASMGQGLFAEHCQNCHGVTGIGRGLASPNLSPQARNFRREPMRLVSAINRLATDDDLVRTIRQGEPGTAMPAFKQLSDAEVNELVKFVRQIQREGLVEQYQLRQEGEAESGQLESWLHERMIAAQPIEVPSLTVTPEVIEAGKSVLSKVGCSNCHGLDGTAAHTPPKMFDSLGRPIQAPNLKRGLFKGGEDFAAIYKRIKLGIPGTPHPALSAVNDDEVAALVAYLMSMR